MTFSEELKEVLLKELEILQTLRKISEDKTDLLINTQTQQIEEITRKEESLLNKIEEIENERTKILDNWGVLSNASIESIIEKIQEDSEKKELQKIREDMLETIYYLAERNAMNSELINDNLDWIDFNLNLYTNATVEPNYGKSSENIKSGSMKFDRKV